MPPTTSRDFQRAAAQRLVTAELLMNQSYTLDAQYIGGYTVECSLKALILHFSPEAERAETLARITKGARMHNPEVLLGTLRDLGVSLPLRLSKRMLRFSLTWTTDLRYETGHKDMGETIAFIKTAKAIHDWAGVQLP